MAKVVHHDRIGAVVIGRNEGEKIRRCLASVVGGMGPVVYSDSGSVDHSVAIARGFAVEVVELSDELPFTAARARNAGFRRLREIDPEGQFVQFVDGDCETCPDWCADAMAAFEEHEDAAIVCGQLRERHATASVFHRLLDLEWRRPAGPAEACGGIFAVRCDAFETVGGFNPEVSAGEEPELCHRLIGLGWRIYRLNEPMAWHDVGKANLALWWRRSVRSGLGYAASLGRGERYGWRGTASVLLWAAVLPASALSCTVVIGAWGLLALGAYLMQWMRIMVRQTRGGWGQQDSALYATACLAAKWPQLVGQALYWLRLRRR